MDPSVLNEQSTKCECEFSIRYGDIFSESVPTVKHAVHSALYILVAGASPRRSRREQARGLVAHLGADCGKDLKEGVDVLFGVVDCDAGTNRGGDAKQDVKRLRTVVPGSYADAFICKD